MINYINLMCCVGALALRGSVRQNSWKYFLMSRIYFIGDFTEFLSHAKKNKIFSTKSFVCLQYVENTIFGLHIDLWNTKIRTSNAINRSEKFNSYYTFPGNYFYSSTYQLLGIPSWSSLKLNVSSNFLN